MLPVYQGRVRLRDNSAQHFIYLHFETRVPVLFVSQFPSMHVCLLESVCMTFCQFVCILDEYNFSTPFSVVSVSIVDSVSECACRLTVFLLAFPSYPLFVSLHIFAWNIKTNKQTHIYTQTHTHTCQHAHFLVNIQSYFLFKHKLLMKSQTHSTNPILFPITSGHLYYLKQQPII